MFAKKKNICLLKINLEKNNYDMLVFMFVCA